MYCTQEKHNANIAFKLKTKMDGQPVIRKTKTKEEEEEDESIRELVCFVSVILEKG